MRAWKDEKKLMDPMFPRLHINDAERGGPKAPPRNKMAMCEQVNRPSQRLSSRSMSTQPLPSSNGTNLVPSASPSHILKTGDYQEFSARRPFNMKAEFRLFQPYGFYNSMNSSVNKVTNEDEPRIPLFGPREKIPSSGGIEHKMEKENNTCSSLSFIRQHQTAFERHEKETRRNDVKSMVHSRNQAEDNCKVSEITDDNAETLNHHPSTKETVLADAAPSAPAMYRTCDSGNRAIVPINHSRRSNVVNDLSILHGTCAQMHQESRSFLIDTARDDNMSRNPERLSRKRIFSAMELPSCSGPPTDENSRNPNRLELAIECPKSNDCASSHIGDGERNIAISDNSVVDSKSSLDISPDDVVRVIGPKFFWSIRRTIAHQQRIFGVQIFELHRLIKVQKLIAESPEMFFEDNVIFNKPSVNFSPEKKLQLENFQEPRALFLKPKVDSQKVKPCLDYAAEDALRKLPDPEKGRITPKSVPKPCPAALTSASFAPDARTGPWCLHTPSGNQWLVPVRSPSEGLIYKPYAGPYPPFAGCITPVFGGCGPMNLTRNDGDCANTAYRIPASYHQGIGVYSVPAAFGRSCFQTYALPMINTSSSSSAVEQMNPFENRFSASDINYVLPFRSPFDVTSQKSGIMADCSRNVQVGSDFQGSTPSTPDERTQRDELSLFPTTPTGQMSQHPGENHNSEQKIQVIKVVPRNPKSASESAARIFQSIQEGRKQHE